MTQPRKPKGCTCEYPKRICRNGSGHDDSCIIHKRWREKFLKAKESRK